MAYETEEYRGRVVRVMFAANDGGGYMIVQVEDDAGNRQSLVGTLHDCVPGTLIEGEVRHVSHPKFGDQLQAVSAMKTSPPADKDGAAIFISGCPGVSEAKARKLTGEIEDGLWDAIRNASPRVIAVIGEDKAHALAKWFGENEALKDARIWLADHGLNRRQVTNAVKIWKLKTLDVVKANPWILAEKVEGVGWKTADMIAQKLGRPMQCVERARAAVLHFLKEDSQKGHAYCDQKELEGSCSRMMGLQRRLVEDATRELAHDKKVVLCVRDDGTDVYRANLYAAEVGIARMVAVLLASPNDADDYEEEVT